MKTCLFFFQIFDIFTCAFIKRILVITQLIFFFTNFIFSQDIHYTNYRSVQSNFNPSLNGNFKGNLKLQAIYRTQYQQTYSNSIIGGEYNIGLTEENWFTPAINLSYDIAGDQRLTTRGAGFGFGFHRIFGKKSIKILSLGLNYHFENLSTKPSAITENTLIGKVNDPDQSLIKINTNYSSLSAGISYKQQFKKANIELGFSMRHINQPDYFFNKGKLKSVIGKRINIHIRWEQQLVNLISIEPAVYYSNTENSNNANLQILSFIKFNKKFKWKAVFGPSHRIGESFSLIAGYQTENTFISVAYDYLYGNIANTLDHFGAIEFGAYHLLSFKSRPKVKNIIICPRL